MRNMYGFKGLFLAGLVLLLGVTWLEAQQKYSYKDVEKWHHWSLINLFSMDLNNLDDVSAEYIGFTYVPGRVGLGANLIKARVHSENEQGFYVDFVPVNLLYVLGTNKGWMLSCELKTPPYSAYMLEEHESGEDYFSFFPYAEGKLKLDLKTILTLSVGYRVSFNDRMSQIAKLNSGPFASLTLGIRGIYKSEKKTLRYKRIAPSPDLMFSKIDIADRIELSDDTPTIQIPFSIDNTGKGKAEEIIVNAEVSNTQAKIVVKPVSIDVIPPGESCKNELSIRSVSEITRREEVPITLKAMEKDGFSAERKYTLVLMPRSQVEQFPPILSGELQFHDQNNNGLLEAYESGEVKLRIKNTGKGNAWSVNVDFDLADESLTGALASFTRQHLIRQIAPGASETITIPIQAKKNIPTTQLEFVARITEANGFDPEPIRMFLNSRAFMPPELIVSDVGVADEAGRNVIMPGQVVSVTARVVNHGSGLAEKVTATVRAGDNVFLGGSERGSHTQNLGDIPPGEYRDVVFEAFCNTRAQSFPLALSLSEKEGEYGIVDVSLGLELQQPQRNPRDFVITQTTQAPLAYTQVPDLSVDIEKNIPQAKKPTSNGIAVIIGNRNYRGTIPEVSYALRDAALVKQYVQQSLGFPAGNILSLENASLTDLRVTFGDELSALGRLSDLVRKGESEIFVYYSGHGAPDPTSRTGYLMPVDGDVNRLNFTGYKIETLYRNLDALGAKSVTVVIDACFSGATGSGQMLIDQASPVGLVIKDPSALIRNGLVITASSGSEIASWHPEARYGLLTYFFLQGLQGAADKDKDGKISVSELSAYLLDQNGGVPYYARLLHGRQQTPQIWGDMKRVVRE